LTLSYLDAQAFAYHVSLGLLALATVLSALRPSGTLARHAPPLRAEGSWVATRRDDPGPSDGHHGEE